MATTSVSITNTKLWLVQTEMEKEGVKFAIVVRFSVYYLPFQKSSKFRLPNKFPKMTKAKANASAPTHPHPHKHTHKLASSPAYSHEDAPGPKNR